MVGGAVVLQADPWGPSDVSARLLRPVTDPNRPEWITLGSEPEPRPRDGYIMSFVAFHERGLGLPADWFMWALPHYYGVELHNFNPNSIAQGYLGIAPH